MENKQEILNSLLQTLKLTRDQKDLGSLVYDAETETVKIGYLYSDTLIVNVAMDSGIAMIRDIMRAIE